jgi:hypothetical protein
MMVIHIGAEDLLLRDAAIVGWPVRSAKAKVRTLGPHGSVLGASALMPVRYFDSHTTLHCAIAL